MLALPVGPWQGRSPGIGAEEFFSFRTMISTNFLIKFIYVLGMLGLSIGGLIIIVQAIQRTGHRRYYGYGSSDILIGILAGIGVITIGNLLWRITCEGWILLFSMHDILGSIEGELRRGLRLT